MRTGRSPRRTGWQALEVNREICKQQISEGQELEIPVLLQAQNRDDLLTVLDVIVAVLYWMQNILEIKETTGTLVAFRLLFLTKMINCLIL